MHPFTFWEPSNCLSTPPSPLYVRIDRHELCKLTWVLFTIHVNDALLYAHFRKLPYSSRSKPLSLSPYRPMNKCSGQGRRERNRRTPNPSLIVSSKLLLLPSISNLLDALQPVGPYDKYKYPPQK